MLIGQVRDLLQKIRAGAFEAADEALLELTSFTDFLAEIRPLYPVVFQERTIGRKVELGLARRLESRLVSRLRKNSAFPVIYLEPVLRGCIFLSGYNDRVTELTLASTIRLGHAGPAAVRIAVSSSFKADLTPDGWRFAGSVKTSNTFDESFLARRGWNFAAVTPYRP